MARTGGVRRRVAGKRRRSIILPSAPSTGSRCRKAAPPAAPAATLARRTRRRAGLCHRWPGPAPRIRGRGVSAAAAAGSTAGEKQTGRCTKAHRCPLDESRTGVGRRVASNPRTRRERREVTANTQEQVRQPGTAMSSAASRRSGEPDIGRPVGVVGLVRRYSEERGIAGRLAAASCRRGRSSFTSSTMGQFGATPDPLPPALPLSSMRSLAVTSPPPSRRS